MSLATRCTSCGTIFRVVQDQLKVSEGWVRCGRCQEVFNALQNLFDLEREAPPPWPPAQAPAAPEPAPAAERAQPAAMADTASDDDTPSDPANLTTQPLLHTASRDFLPEEEGADPEDTGFEDARFNEDLLREDLREEEAEEEEEDKNLEVFGASQLEPMPSFKSYAKSAARSSARASGEDEDKDEAPSFVLAAQRAERWQHPVVRVVLMLLALLSGALLLAQVGLHWRAEFVAHWPESRTALGPLCAALDCQIGPPRRLESLAVDASGLTQLDVPGQYRLQVVLRNRGRAPVLLPAVELALTDAQGKLVARRALTTAELGARQDSLGAGGELPLQAAFSVGEQPIVGYTVEIFYP